jgi:hypothetical protein
MAGIWTARADNPWSLAEKLQTPVKEKKSTIEPGLEKELCTAIWHLCQDLKNQDPDGGKITPASSLY